MNKFQVVCGDQHRPTHAPLGQGNTCTESTRSMSYASKQYPSNSASQSASTQHAKKSSCNTQTTTVRWPLPTAATARPVTPQRGALPLAAAAAALAALGAHAGVRPCRSSAVIASYFDLKAGRGLESSS